VKGVEKIQPRTRKMRKTTLIPQEAYASRTNPKAGGVNLSLSTKKEKLKTYHAKQDIA